MAAIDSYAKRLAPPGSLIGISTIHFVKWLVIDDGRRLMMVSDYDGSWESYIDEFAEMILSGLDAIWETAVWLSSRWRARPSGVQAVPSQPSGAVGSLLQRVPGGDGLEHGKRSDVCACVRRRHRRPSRRQRCSGYNMASLPATRLTETALADIQGFITSGYGHLSYAAYLFLQFQDAVQAQRWLGAIGPAITSAKPWPKTATGEKLKPAVALNVAFTAGGLAGLGLPPDVLCTFPVEFQEGIADVDAREFSAIAKRAIPRRGSSAEADRRRFTPSSSFMPCRRRSS